ERLLRQVNRVYQKNNDLLMSSGLYKTLADAGLLIAHEEAAMDLACTGEAYKVIQPRQVPFISYPYEWCFSQLKDAALLTLHIQQVALDHGMSLKDASAYNVQFLEGRPVFIDTLSFEECREGKPWVAYRQFCQHFLAPLALASYRDIRLSQLLRIHADGVPLDLASALLPWRTKLRMHLLAHIHLHAGAQKRYAERQVETRGRRMGRMSLLGLVDNLKTAVQKLDWSPGGTPWADYYQDTNYTPRALQDKEQLVSRFLDQVRPTSVWDFGANIGLFSRLASQRGIPTLSLDADPAAVERNYRSCVASKEKNILPLLLDLTNPSAGLGWNSSERIPFLERGRADAALVLALVHHLAIANNLPLGRIAGFFRSLCRHLIIEFVPKSDSQVQRLLRTREDIFPEYAQEKFEQEFAAYFRIVRREGMRDSERVLYLMEGSSSV
ncbi:MAG: hypothetical protein ACRD2R_01895, partial [Terriglobales bacterium]